MDNNNASPIKQWSVREYKSYSRTQRWYIVTGIIILILLLLAVWSQNIFAAVGLLLLSVIILVRAYSEPPRLQVSLTEDGIEVGDGFYEFRDLDNFWIVYEPPHVKMLYVEFASRWKPRLPIPLENEDPVEVREILLRFLSESNEREGEPISEAFGRWLKL